MCGRHLVPPVWVRVDTDLGPVDFVTTHFASSANNPPCDATRCPPICAAGVETNQCNAREGVEFFDSRSGAALQLASGALNARPDSPTLAASTDASAPIDFVLARADGSCDVRAYTEPRFGEPSPKRFRGLHWPSDHARLIAELRCA